MWRVVRLTVLGLAGSLVVTLCMLLPDLIRFVPTKVRVYWAEELFVLCFVAHAVGRRLAVDWFPTTRFGQSTAAFLDTLDRFSDWALGGGLAKVLGAICAGLLIMWVPHYLTGPWSRDLDTFAVLAQSWDNGILPYRDIRAYNFPGATYLAWLLGKLFGWGHTVPLYAFDAACVVLLGVILTGWSRRALGGAVPGLMAYVAFLSLYLNLEYGFAVQRDWLTAFLVCVGLLVMQAWPCRLTRLGAALAAALALTIRPQAVLFLPAFCWEVARGTDVLGPGRFSRRRAVARWLLGFSLLAAIAFAPLPLAGIADDFARGLRVAAYGGPYSKATPANTLRAFIEQFASWRVDVPLIATVVLAALPLGRLSGIARTWSLAILGVVCYGPIHPVHHRYLWLPLLILSSVTWALAVAWLLSSPRIARPMRVLAVALLFHDLMPEPPGMCDLGESYRALRPLVRGEMPAKPPLGSPRSFSRDVGLGSGWEHYRALLQYIKSETSPRTLVANVLNQVPYEPINGPTGRLSPFRAESGICWMHLVDVDLDPEFAESLIECPDSVVVWRSDQATAEPRLAVPKVVAVIRKYYEPAARFGSYEVWRRKPMPSDK